MTCEYFAALVEIARQQQQQQTEPLSIIYPSSAITYIDYWPDDVELSLLCATTPLWSTLTFQWFKDDVLITNSDRWRYYNIMRSFCQYSVTVGESHTFISV